MAHNNKFGMFIHWGIYAATELQEQAIIRYHMDKAEYEGLAKTFDPYLYDPEEWVLFAKNSGAKYICFTTKHHDGFCMWDTKHTDYNIMNTPYGKDTLKMLADACAKHGMLLSLYYSNPDWHYEFGYNPASTHQWPVETTGAPVDIEKYKAYVKAQITELLTNYGPIYSFFWDIPPRIYDPSMNQLIRELQPEIFINDRGWDKGDFSTPEREYKSEDGLAFTRMTEACNSVGEQSWGYRAKEDFYTKRYLCSSIDRIMAMGGSYILNVGPDARGVITDEYKKHFNKVSDWYLRMEGCLEGAEPDAFNYDIRKTNQCIATKKDGKTYLHFPDGVKSSALAIRYFPCIPKKVRLMNNGKELPFAKELLPEYHSNGGAVTFLHIYDIPADDFADEPIVVEITWN